jgi:hexosaminidase
MLAIIPKPEKLTILPGELHLANPITISGDGEAKQVLVQFASSLEQFFALKPTSQEAQVLLEIREDMQEEVGCEGYLLDISSEKVTIRAAQPAGLFYGMQTLRQLLAPEIQVSGYSLPCLSILDKPRFKWRGFMLDEARHFFGIQTVKRVLDWLAYFKINTFHWHLTDYQGWRVEIAKYNLLTEVGGRRAGSQTRSFSKQFRGMDLTPHAGWYSQDEIREIVAYAAQRYITIVPELDLPGHFSAALAAYPHLGCTKEEMEVRMEWGIFNDVACVGSQETREFLYDVLDEFSNLFPGPYIHLGGDEVRTDHWRDCPECQRVKGENGLKTISGLNSLIMNDLGSFLQGKGKTPVVWNEALSPSLDKRTVIMHWTPVPFSLLKTKRALQDGYQVVFQTFWESYFDYAHSFIPLKNVHRAKSLDQVPRGAWDNVLGVQGALWTEFVADEARLQWNVFPRLAAKAEVGWSQSGDRSYVDFKDRWGGLRSNIESLGLANPAPLEASDPSSYRRSLALLHDVIVDMQAEQHRWNLVKSK